MNNIEIEIRSFITKEQYEKLLKFFIENSTLTKEDFQETYYFDCEQDLRIQKNNLGCKIWLKDGKIHDEFRKEIEIFIDKENFEKAKAIFEAIGLKTEIIWLRERKQFNWDDIKVCLDFTKGYGYIIELEKKGNIENQVTILNELKNKLKELEINLTPKEEFDKAYEYYKNNWRKLI